MLFELSLIVILTYGIGIFFSLFIIPLTLNCEYEVLKKRMDIIKKLILYIGFI